MSESVFDTLNGQIKDVLKRRNEIIEQFIKTWVAVNAIEDCSEPGFQNWFINHCVLCEKQTERGLEYSMRLRTDDEIRLPMELIEENAKLKRLLEEACQLIDANACVPVSKELAQWYADHRKQEENK